MSTEKQEPITKKASQPILDTVINSDLYLLPK